MSVMLLCSELKRYLFPPNIIYVVTSNLRPAKMSGGRQYIMRVIMTVTNPAFFFKRACSFFSLVWLASS